MVYQPGSFDDPSYYPEIEVSRFDPFTNKEGRTLPGIHAKKDNLYKQLVNFKEGFYATSITSLRNMKDKKLRDKYKQEKLPAFTFSASIEGHRNRNNIKQHSGVLVIDIDHEGFLPFLKKQQEQNPDYTIEHFRDHICQEGQDGKTNILFGGLSASGTGLFLMFRVQPTQHLEAFYAIEWELLENYGIKIDASCKDVTRLRFCTYDPEAIIRPWNDVEPYVPPREYTEWKKIQDERITELKAKQKTFTSSAHAAGSIVNTACNMIDSAVPGTRHNTVIKAARLLGGYAATGVLEIEYCRAELRRAVEKMAMNYPNGEVDRATEYKAIDDGLSHGQLAPIQLHVMAPDDPQFQHFAQMEEEQQRTFRDFYAEVLKANRAGIPFSDLDLDPMCRLYSIDPDRGHAIAARLYRLHQDEFDFDSLVSAIKLRTFIRKRWEIRRNVVTNDILVRVKNSGNSWRKIRIEDLWISICEQRFKCSFEDLNRLLQTDMVEEYNPFVEYFKKVEYLWDTKTDHIKQLADSIQVYNVDKEYFRSMIRKMLVRTVRCALEEQYVNRYVFVFASLKQATGKSWLIRWLNPWGMEQYYAENPLGEGKDDRIRMSEVFIYNLEELQALTKRDVNTLKAIISSGSSKERRPFERLAQTFSRRCSFFGSTNRTDFLVDDANTRWLIFETGEIDWSYREKINLPHLWSQAYNLYLNKEEMELTKDETRMQDVQNLRFTEATSEEEMLKRYFIPIEAHNPQAIMLTATDILNQLQTLSRNPRIQFTLNSLTRALKRNAYEICWVNKVRCHAVIPINQDIKAVMELDARRYQMAPEELSAKIALIEKLQRDEPNPSDTPPF